MSQRGSGYERKSLDLYKTPPWVTECLLGSIVGRPGTIWEPAANGGDMVKVLQGEFMVMASDIDKGVDFLKVKSLPKPGIKGIVSNPPYSLAEEFCAHALELVRPVGGFVAMLLRCDFDYAKTRGYLFRDCAAWSKKVVLTKRIVWFVEADGKPKASPSFNHSWYLWSHEHRGPPTIEYAP
jgi:hypothetical protein